MPKLFPIDSPCQNWFIGRFSTTLQHFRFSNSFQSREPMTKKEKSDHSETISNRFLMLKLVYKMIFYQFGTFSIFRLFFIKGTDDQKEKSDHPETFSNRFFMSNWFIGRFSTNLQHFRLLSVEAISIFSKKIKWRNISNNISFICKRVDISKDCLMKMPTYLVLVPKKDIFHKCITKYSAYLINEDDLKEYFHYKSPIYIHF